jgi:hypothetical protein
VAEDRVLPQAIGAVFILNDNRVDHSKHVQKIKAKRSTVVAGRDNVDVDISTLAPETGGSTFDRRWALAIISVLVLLAVAGFAFGAVGLLEWKYAAVPIVLGALGVATAVARLGR